MLAGLIARALLGLLAAQLMELDLVTCAHQDSGPKPQGLTTLARLAQLIVVLADRKSVV